MVQMDISHLDEGQVDRTWSKLDTARTVALDKAKAEKTGVTPEEVKTQIEASIPAGRYERPDELAAYVAWLCSEPARYQTGTFIPIDGGMIRSLP